MTDVTFSNFENALSVPEILDVGRRLRVAPAPNPFVAPTLSSQEKSPLGAEVVFVRASAAVGKSTLASQLSASRRLPLLDLASVPVSTGSLKALLLEISSPKSALDEFHAGRLPVIVDALDEGRLVSQENGFEAFMTTTAELLAENRSVKDKPKLIFFGRYESTELAELVLEIANPDIARSSLEVGYFDKEHAWELIYAYADAIPEKDSQQYRQHKHGAVRDLINAYFVAIEAALGLLSGELWQSKQGRAFAGYAPVLAALGSLIARIDNFVEVTNRLQQTGTHEAWAVIETVLKTITDREQTKLREKMDPGFAARMPAQAYDSEEQLTLLAQFVQGRPLAGSGRIRLNAGDQNQYESKVGIILPDHPFIRQRDFANPVLASAVMTHAILRDQMSASGVERLGELSRQPFLWRSIAPHLGADVLLNGTHVGHILNSYWNDPVRVTGTVEIYPTEDSEMARVSIPADRRVAFNITLPVIFYGQLRDATVDVGATVRLIGQGVRGAGATFYNQGKNILICDQLELEADSIRFDGDCWYEAGSVSAPQNLGLHLSKGARIGWGGELARTFPWNRQPSVLPPPYAVQQEGAFDSLVRECASRILDGGNVALNADYTPAPGDPHLRWVARNFAERFPTFIQLALNYGVAVAEKMQARGSPKVRVRFGVAWSEILDALKPENVDSRWGEFVREGRATLNN